MRLQKLLIILLFTLLAVSMSMAAVAETGGNVLVGTITAIDPEKRELIVSPVHPARVAGETSRSSAVVHVKLEWDADPQTPFDGLLPGCVTRGNAVRIKGLFERDMFFLAETIHGCGAGDFHDRTGVRFRLNRAQGACSPQ